MFPLIFTAVQVSLKWEISRFRFISFSNYLDKITFFYLVSLIDTFEITCNKHFKHVCFLFCFGLINMLTPMENRSKWVGNRYIMIIIIYGVGTYTLR